MPSKKLGRINEDIRLTLSDLMREVKDPRISGCDHISVTAADATSDLKYCKVYLSVMGLKDEKDFLKGLKSAHGWFRKELARRLNLRSTPELTFILDHSIEHGAYINSIIAGLDIPADEEEGSNEDDHDR